MPVTQVGQLNITKLVRNSRDGTFSKSATAANGETVEFEIVVTNTGSHMLRR